MDVSSQDIDSPLNDNYGDNGGGNPGSPADDAVTGNGTGAPGTSVPGTDQDNADPAQLNIVDGFEKDRSRHFRQCSPGVWRHDKICNQSI
ncbi:MAG: hypothetical protein IPG82_10250 [Saprospiraceae bacterium]|nr:hypothetical protein [Saprospiraceae bacterium]